MAKIPNRDDLEAEVAGVFGRLSARQRKKLLDVLGDPPDFGKVPQSLWTESTAEMQAAWRPLFEKIYLEAAERLMALVFPCRKTEGC